MSSRGSSQRLLAEGLVIVTSILLAFAIDAWWGNSQEDKARTALVEALVGDFQTARTHLAGAIARSDSLHAMTSALLLASASQQPLPRDSIQFLATGAVTGAPDHPTVPRYQAAVASGEIRLLASDSLLVALIDFEAAQHTYAEWEHEHLAGFFNGALHTLRQELGTLSVLTPAGGRSEPPARFTPADLNEVIQRRSVYAAIEPIHVARFNMARVLREMDSAAERVLIELEKLKD